MTASSGGGAARPQPRVGACGPALLAALLGCLGCSGVSSELPPDGHRADARPPKGECTEVTAILGRCEIQGTGDDCTGVPGEDRAFVPLTDGSALRATFGPQGALMFVLALRTTDIFPGDPANPASVENPVVEIFLDDGVAEMSHYRARPPFTPVADEPGVFETAGLFVILERTANGLAGMEINAQATISDRDGEFRCGHVQFVATN